MKLTNAVEGKEYIIKSVNTYDSEMDAFLFSLGCYSGEPIKVIKHLKGSMIIMVKNARYNIDKQLADTIDI